MLNPLSQYIETSPKKAAAIMETTSKRPKVRSVFCPTTQRHHTPYMIPNDFDEEKRKLAQTILASYEGFVSMIFDSKWLCLYDIAIFSPTEPVYSQLFLYGLLQRCNSHKECVSWWRHYVRILRPQPGGNHRASVFKSKQQ